MDAVGPSLEPFQYLLHSVFGFCLLRQSQSQSQLLTTGGLPPISSSWKIVEPKAGIK
jgi:hypothetical protein